MARPQKEGLDYFSLDVDMDQDDKIALVEAKHKIIGFAIVIKLLMKIYKEGYFYKWTEREQLLFSSKVNVDIDTINEVLNDCLKWDFFNIGLYESHQILTSKGIQKRYLEAVKRRKEINLIQEYLLVEAPESTDTVTVNIVNVNIKGINVDNNPPEGTLIPSLIPKVKESKVKESKIKNSFAHFWDAYPKKKSKGQAEKAFAKLKVDEQFLEVILAAIKRAKKSTDWQKEKGQFIPYPATWLNAKGWEDEQNAEEGKKNATNQGDNEPWKHDRYMRAMFGSEPDGQ